jgi:glycosyltransferase involved in cell wall biosynthesis
MGQRLLRRRKPHVMIGHRLSTPAKRPLLRILGAGRDPGRVVVHSTSQLARASALGLGAPRAKCIPYGVDLDFWRGASLEREPLVAAAGRDHRDYSTLAAACSGLAASVVVTGSSAHSPAADAREPEAWPANFRLVKLDYPALRRLYAAASVVVVPLVETDFQAGVTALLEAMAMGKAVVVSATAGLADVIDPGCCVPVPPGSPAALREAIASLIDNPERRRRLGAAARERAEARYGLDAFCAALAGTLEDAACAS